MGQCRNNSCSRTAAKAHCQDILKAIQDLVDAKVRVEIAVDIEDLDQLPPITPKIKLSQRKRCAVYESQVSRLEEELKQSRNVIQDSLVSIQETQAALVADV